MTEVINTVSEIEQDTLETLNLVFEKAKQNILKGIQSGAIDINDPKLSHITIGKIIAKAAITSATDDYLQLGKHEKEVKNLRHFI